MVFQQSYNKFITSHTERHGSNKLLDMFVDAVMITPTESWVWRQCHIDQCSVSRCILFSWIEDVGRISSPIVRGCGSYQQSHCGRMWVVSAVILWEDVGRISSPILGGCGSEQQSHCGMVILNFCLNFVPGNLWSQDHDNGHL